MDVRDYTALQARLLNEGRAAGRRVATACRAGDVGEFSRAISALDDTVDGWRHAMRHVGRLKEVSDEIKAAFVEVWVEANVLPLAVGHRRTLADALAVLMPFGYRGQPLKLYRGASWRERRCRTYGFSWSTRIDVARQFAENWAGSEEGAVVLETEAPPEAILLITESDGLYDEGEVVVHPFRLLGVAVAHRLV